MRLIEAVRGNHATPTIQATYAYTYDDADNMLTKQVPWYDDFEDGNITGWSGSTGYFSVTGGVMKNTSDASVRELYLTETDADHDLSFDYVRYSGTGRADIVLRTVGGNDQLYLEINPTNLRLRQVDGGTLSTLVTYNTTVAEDMWYKLRAILDGTSVKVYWGAEGADFNEVISTTTTETTTGRAAYIKAQANSEHGFDNIQLIAGTRSTTETFTYNNANEQISHAKNGVTTTMSYDDWGQLTQRDDGIYDATYVYRYGGKLYSATSNFPGEGDVTYETGGDGKRRSRIAGTTETWYNWDADFSVLSEEDEADGFSGDLSRSYVGSVAHVDGMSPTTGAYSYYTADRLGSLRGAWNGAKSASVLFEYDAYGSVYGYSGDFGATNRGFTGHDLDEVSELYFAPYRYYNSETSRWSARDPLGDIDGPNFYEYVLGNPVRFMDILGLACGPGEGLGDRLVPDRAPPFVGLSWGECCKKHDDCYGCEGKEQGKGKGDCDQDFKKCMKKKCEEFIPPFRQLCKGWAQTYYNMVHKLGRKPFENARKKCCGDGGENESPK